MMIYEKGGAVMVLLTLMSVYALGVIIFKIAQFVQANVFDRRFSAAKQNVTGATGTIAGIVYQAAPRLVGVRVGAEF